jgi:hypothetical protein
MLQREHKLSDVARDAAEELVEFLTENTGDRLA